MTNTQTPEPTQDPVDDLAAGDSAAHAQIETLKGELEQLRAQSLRDRADIENQRRRLERDVRNAVRFANKQLLGDLLPILDSMEAALVTADAADPLRDGVVLTLRELNRLAENNGLIEIAPAPGDGFDPEKHQAMSAIDTAEVAPGAVVQTFQKGYMLNEQLLRPALVAVAKHD